MSESEWTDELERRDAVNAEGARRRRELWAAIVSECGGNSRSRRGPGIDAVWCVGATRRGSSRELLSSRLPDASTMTFASGPTASTPEMSSFVVTALGEVLITFTTSSPVASSRPALAMNRSSDSASASWTSSPLR